MRARLLRSAACANMTASWQSLRRAGGGTMATVQTRVLQAWRGNSLFRHDASTPANLAVLCGSKCRTRLLRCQLLLEHDVFASSKTAPTTLRRTLRDAHYHKESSAPLYVQMSLIRHATR